MTEILWRALAWLISRGIIADWLFQRAVKTPYEHITSADKASVYMFRWWLFNPYFDHENLRRFSWLPFSARVHLIMRPDQDRHLHDHPWNARTIILSGGYIETRENGHTFMRSRGQTASLKFGEFHKIDHVMPGGAMTLFLTWRYQGTWGFLVNGRKVPHSEMP